MNTAHSGVKKNLGQWNLMMMMTTAMLLLLLMMRTFSLHGGSLRVSSLEDFQLGVLL